MPSKTRVHEPSTMDVPTLYYKFSILYIKEDFDPTAVLDRYNSLIPNKFKEYKMG
jgi:hypothetical protein